MPAFDQFGNLNRIFHPKPKPFHEFAGLRPAFLAAEVALMFATPPPQD